MKHIVRFIISLVVFLPINSAFSQCTSFNNDPLLQPLLIPPCGGTEFTPIQYSQAQAFLLPALNQGSIYNIDLCSDDSPWAPDQMELVIVLLPTMNVVNFTFDCSIQFEPPFSGDYLLIFNDAFLCGVPIPDFDFGISITQSCVCVYDRLQMTQFVLDPTSGIPFRPALSTLWSPFIDFGFGPGFEGMVPQGTLISPPFPELGGGVEAPFDAFFFYIDDAPRARFEHPTRFILIDPTDCAPSLSNGSILIFDDDWWPLLEPPDALPFEPFPHESVSPFPPAPDNPDGLLSGFWIPWDEIFIPPIPPAVTTPKKSAAIVIAGDNRSDMTADIPRWRKQLQDSLGMDSTRILGSSDGMAVTAQEFCDLLDTLCAMECLPDTIYIRISTHGSIDTLWFHGGTYLTGSQLCTKMKKIAKLGVPIMLLIEACNSESLYDAQNWGFPAGSMIMVGATSGRYALGGTVFEADANGNPIPGTSVTGGLLSGSLIKCQNDQSDNNNDNFPDQDTNKDGMVDDCEAFNWVDSIRPCYVLPLLNDSFKVGTYSISLFRMYPAGPPADCVADTFIVENGETFAVKGKSMIELDPMPSYRPVGKFGKNMNWNVQNMTGSDKTAFYMTFCGDVTDGDGSSWESTADDLISGDWSELFGATATYDESKDETTVCWMATGDAASNGDYVHFGYQHSTKELRPKRQRWADAPSESPGGSAAFMMDVSSVPTTVSNVHLDASGSPLTVKTVNLSKTQGGTGHAVNYTIGYRVSPNEIPLVNLSQGDPLLSDLPLHLVTSGTLDTNDFIEFTLEVPNDIRVGETLILQVDLDWTLNSNTNSQLIQWPSLNPSICEGDITFVDTDIIPKQVNSDGKITLNDVIFQNGVTSLNAIDGVLVTPDSSIDIPVGAKVYVYDYGCSEPGIVLLSEMKGQEMKVGSTGEIILEEIKEK